jgi:hypothetical protein
MNRRSSEVQGWVNFPVDHPGWRNTKEGGMFVKLVVCDDRDFDEKLGVCAGVHVHDVLSEVLVNDDQRPYPTHFDVQEDDPRAIEKITEVYEKQREWDEYHYPHMHDAEDRHYCSRSYLCSMVLGSTGWSGYDDNLGLWRCTYDDLTEEGKSLYNTIQWLYPGCKLHLLTFLDT